MVARSLLVSQLNNDGLVGACEPSKRAAGVPVLALIGGNCGAFGGMGIVAKLCSTIVMSEEGRLALSGPEVIETVAGVGYRLP